MMVLLNYGDWKKTLMTRFESSDINLNDTIICIKIMLIELTTENIVYCTEIHKYMDT